MIYHQVRRLLLLELHYAPQPRALLSCAWSFSSSKQYIFLKLWKYTVHVCSLPYLQFSIYFHQHLTILEILLLSQKKKIRSLWSIQPYHYYPYLFFSNKGHSLSKLTDARMRHTMSIDQRKNHPDFELQPNNGQQVYIVYAHRGWNEYQKRSSDWWIALEMEIGQRQIGQKWNNG